MKLENVRAKLTAEGWQQDTDATEVFSAGAGYERVEVFKKEDFVIKVYVFRNGKTDDLKAYKQLDGQRRGLVAKCLNLATLLKKISVS